MKDKYQDFFLRLKGKSKEYAKKFWMLNWEAKLGLFLLTPPLIGTVFFLMTLLGVNNSFLKDGQYEYYLMNVFYRKQSQSFYYQKWYGWNYVYGDDGYIDGDMDGDMSGYTDGNVNGNLSGSIPCQTTPAIPIYLGFMAIAGAYLIKGNLKSEK